MYNGCREFEMAEIEHFVDPSDKSHAKFAALSHIEVPLLSASNQMDGKPTVRIPIGEAVQSVRSLTPPPPHKSPHSHIQSYLPTKQYSV